MAKGWFFLGCAGIFALAALLVLGGLSDEPAPSVAAAPAAPLAVTALSNPPEVTEGGAGPILAPDYQEPDPVPAPPQAPTIPDVAAEAYIEEGAGPILVPDYQEPDPTPAPPDAPKLPGVVANAYIVVDAATGAVLAEHQAHQRRPVASLTKIMTALLVLEQARLDEVVTVDDAISRLSRRSTVMGVVPGEQLTVRDLLYGMMLPSGNDAALALAIHVGGAESAFVGMMNERADGLEMRNTHFANSHGLDSRRGNHYSSAYDLSLLTRVAMENATFREIVGTYSWSAQGLLQPYGYVQPQLTDQQVRWSRWCEDWLHPPRRPDHRRLCGAQRNAPAGRCVRQHPVHYRRHSSAGLWVSATSLVPLNTSRRHTTSANPTSRPVSLSYVAASRALLYLTARLL